MSEPIISFQHADILNGESVVVYDLNLDILPGDFVYIVGKVGTGKTSIIRTMTGENALKKGEGTVCGYHLENLLRREIPFLRRKLGVVFQDFQLLLDKTVFENLDFVLRSTGWKKLLEREQRIAIARALLNQPEVILADEPTGNLDAETADGIMELMCRINKERGTAVVIVTHNRRIFEKYRGRVMVCRDETCVEEKDDQVIDLGITI